MIFKTDSSIEGGFKEKFSFLNKSIKNIQRDYKSGNGLIASIFSKDSIPSKDIEAIKNMSSAMESGSTVAQAWQANLKGCTAETNKFLLI